MAVLTFDSSGSFTSLFFFGLGILQIAQIVAAGLLLKVHPGGAMHSHSVTGSAILEIVLAEGLTIFLTAFSTGANSEAFTPQSLQ